MNLAPAYDQWLEELESKTEVKIQTAIAQRMMKKNMALADIADLTGLSIEVLQSLRPNESAS